MAPKLLPRGRRSQQKHPQLIPIYGSTNAQLDFLADKNEQNMIRQLSKKIESLAKYDLQAINKSLFVFILKICGLSSIIEKINWNNQIESLKDLLQQMSEQTHKNIFINDLFLINQKSKFHTQFIERVNTFLSLIFSDELFLLQETQLIKIFHQTLLTISKCKMRNIRNCSITLSGLVMNKLAIMYQQLHNEKSSKKADKILAVIDRIYLQQVIKPRLKDIDIKIREKSFQIIGQIFLLLKHQFLHIIKLNQYYTQVLIQNKSKIIQLCLKSILFIFSIDQSTITYQLKKNIQEYALSIVKIMEEIVFLPNRNSCLAMEILSLIHTLNPKLDSLKPKIIAKIFEIHGYEKFQDGLKKAVHIFFQSLIPFSSKEDLNEHRSRLIIQIIHLLCSINSKKLLETILKQFFNAHPNLFTFDEMFLLLFTEYYHQQGKDIELQSKQLSVLCTMICQFNIFIRNFPKSDTKQNEQQSYNKNILTNSKQIIFDKITKHQAISHLYLRLFSLLYKPIAPTLASFLNFIYDKIMDIIKQEQYLTFSDNSLILIQQIIKYCVDICQFVFDGHVRVQAMIKNFGIYEIIDKDEGYLENIELIKLGSLVAKFQITELFSLKLLNNVINSYLKSKDKIIKLESIMYLYHFHKWLFVQLFANPSVTKYQEYIDIRNIVMQFCIQTVLDNQQQESMIKLAVFNVLCKTLKLTTNSKISDIPVIYYQPSPLQMQIIYHFIDEHIHFEDDQTLGEVTMMFANISIETQELHEQILKNIFEVLSECYKLSLNKFSIKFIIKFILSNNQTIKMLNRYLNKFIFQLIKNQISSQNNNKFIFWRLFSQLMNEIITDDQEKFQIVLCKLVDLYFRYKKHINQIKSLLSNKLMLFIADSIDRVINSGNYLKLNVVKSILNKVHRRFPKETLHRLLIFFNSKTERINDEGLKQMRELLTKISKTGKTTVKKTGADNNQVEETSSESEDEQQKNQNDEKQHSSDEKDKDRDDVEDEIGQQTPIQAITKKTRSKTKRKN